jgi:predicted flap endonuclease-1-like 5' DNA nuclease
MVMTIKKFLLNLLALVKKQFNNLKKLVLSPTTKNQSYTDIIKIESIGQKYAAALKENNISTVENLLVKCKTKLDREELSKKTGFPVSLILKWANHSDLFRIKGVAGQFAELLEASGVDTVVELSKRVPENLVKKMEEVNEAKNLTRKTPTLEQVTEWVEQSKKLPRALEY